MILFSVCNNKHIHSLKGIKSSLNGIITSKLRYYYYY